MHIHTGLYNSAIIKNESVSFAEMWMDLETVIESESEKGKQTLFISTYMWNLEK